jgi:hypothetical protein
MRSKGRLIVVTLSCWTCFAQTPTQTLARDLSVIDTRPRAIQKVLSSRAESLPMLLIWTEAPPDGVDRLELFIGMAEAFGKLGAIEAIPFLIKHICLQSSPGSVDIWTKDPSTIQSRLPSVAALIKIGPDSSRALIQDWTNIERDDDNLLAAMFVISRIPGVPDAEAVLDGEMGRAKVMLFRAEESLKALLHQ